jgi:hypothetical protein
VPPVSATPPVPPVSATPPVPAASPAVNHSANAKTASEIIVTAIRDLLTPNPVNNKLSDTSSKSTMLRQSEYVNQTPGNILSTAVAARGQSGGTRSKRKRKSTSKKRRN